MGVPKSPLKRSYTTDILPASSTRSSTDVGTNFVGSVLIESFLPIVLTVLRQETADEGFQLTSVPVDTDFGFPQICIDISFPGPLIPNP